MTSTPAETEHLPVSVRWFAPWRWRKRYQLLGLLFLPAYPLSVGPIVWLHELGFISQQHLDILSSVYYPLQIAYENSEWCQYLLGQCTDFWRSLAWLLQ
ncbi:hypothetical protein GC163_16335 [bacterium]|nr:hypothetical protein [bacterium]